MCRSTSEVRGTRETYLMFRERVSCNVERHDEEREC
jgi:hypothetical protein